MRASVCVAANFDDERFTHPSQLERAGVWRRRGRGDRSVGNACRPAGRHFPLGAAECASAVKLELQHSLRGRLAALVRGNQLANRGRVGTQEMVQH